MLRGMLFGAAFVTAGGVALTTPELAEAIPLAADKLVHWRRTRLALSKPMTFSRIRTTSNSCSTIGAVAAVVGGVVAAGAGVGEASGPPR